MGNNMILTAIAVATNDTYCLSDQCNFKENNTYVEGPLLNSTNDSVHRYDYHVLKFFVEMLLNNYAIDKFTRIKPMKMMKKMTRRRWNARRELDAWGREQKDLFKPEY